MSERVGPEYAGLAPADVATLIRGRRTTARFNPEPPPARLIEEAVAVARWAPNHKLTQPWRFYHLGRESIEAVVELNCELVAAQKGTEAAAVKRRRWGAIPGWLVATCVRDADPLRAREDYAACSCAIQNLMLYLWSHGVASKWTTGAVTREPGFYRCLDIDPETEDVVALLWYGYPDEAPRMRRKPVTDILFDRP